MCVYINNNNWKCQEYLTKNYNRFWYDILITEKIKFKVFLIIELYIEYKKWILYMFIMYIISIYRYSIISHIKLSKVKIRYYWIKCSKMKLSKNCQVK